MTTLRWSQRNFGLGVLSRSTALGGRDGEHAHNVVVIVPRIHGVARWEPNMKPLVLCVGARGEKTEPSDGQVRLLLL